MGNIATCDTNCSEFTPEQSSQLEVANVTASFLSLAGSVFIMACYIWLKELRTFAFRLVFIVSICDFFYAIANILGDAGGNEDTHLGANPALCLTQALLMSYSGLASMLWSLSIGFTLHMAFLKQDPRFHVGRIEEQSKKYHMLNWGLPFLLTLLPLTTDSYGDVGGWCWIQNDTHAARAWRFIQFYIILVGAVVYNCIIYYRIFVKIKQLSHGSGDDGKAMANRMKFYPLVLIICHFAGIFVFFFELFGGTGAFGLSMWTICTSSLMGLLNALVYGLTPDILQRVRGICRSAEPQRSEHDMGLKDPTDSDV